MAIVNGSLQEGYKDAAWFAANPTLVLLIGQKVNLEQTGTYKLGDGTTQLSALSFLGASGSGLSGLTTNKVLKATSSTTAGDSKITDDGSSVNISIPTKVLSYLAVIGVDDQLKVESLISVDNGGYFVVYDNVGNPVLELDGFNNSIKKNGVEVATVNDTVIIQQFGAASTNLAASFVYYFALVTANIGFLTLANSLTRALNIIKTGVITNFEFFIYVGGAIGSSQNSVIDLLIFNSNGTLNRTINLSNTVLFNDANRINKISLSALSINVTQGEIYNFRLTTGALTTAPTIVQINGGFIIK